MRLEMVPLSASAAPKAAFGLRIRAGNATLASLSLEPFRNFDGEGRLGIAMDGEVRCGKAVEVRDASGSPAWVTALCGPGNGDKRDAPWELQITGTRPS